MDSLKTPIEFDTAFSAYTATHVIGEGGAGRVFAASDRDGTKVAIKVLNATSADKRKRFKNETGFLQRQRHANLVPVSDYGIVSSKSISGPFYVMPLYEGSLRDRLRAGVKSEHALALFAQILDGVEAAHLCEAVHRDLKPENVLVNGNALAIADFGVARFTGDQLLTFIETNHGTRLANFEYAAPEQRRRGELAGVPADIFALGLMLNELFTGQVPHGSGFRTIGSVDVSLGYIDEVVEAMIRQDPAARLQSVEDVKRRLRVGHEGLMVKQRLSVLENRVVPAGEIDHPLVVKPLRIVDADWEQGRITLFFDRAPTADWIQALYRMGSYQSMVGADPSEFAFTGAKASVNIDGGVAQQIVDFFKAWIPMATQRLKLDLEEAEQRRAYAERRSLEAARAAVLAKQEVMSKLRI